MTQQRLIIHIGDHKAGSTSIQSALAQGKVHLTSGTLSYPLPAQRYSHNFMAQGFIKSARSRFSPDTTAMEKVGKLARAKTADTTILSAEEFEKAFPSKVAKAINTHFQAAQGRLDVFCLLRPHTSRLTATIAENIKCGWASDDPTQDIAKLRRYWLGYTTRLLRWSAVFGKSLKVSAFLPHEMADGQPLNEMMARTLGLENVTIQPSRRANGSLSTQDLMRIHLIQKSLPNLKTWERHTIGWDLARKFATQKETGRDATKLELGQAQAAHMRRRYWADATLIERIYFNNRRLFRDALTQAVDQAPKQALTLQPQAWLSTQDLQDLEAVKQDVQSLISQKNWHTDLKRSEVRHLMGQQP